MTLPPSTPISQEIFGEIILGIDPGTAITGYGLIKKKGSKLTVIDYGCIRPPAKYKLSDRYLILFEGVYALVDQWHPQAMSIETQYVSKNVLSAMKIGMARSAIMIAAKKHSLPIYSYAPSKAKLAVVGSGAASKAQVQGMVQRLLCLASPPSPFDAADALALAITHAHASKWAKEI